MSNKRRFIESICEPILNLPDKNHSFKEAATADLAVRSSQIRAIYPLNYSLSADRLTRNNTLYPLKSIIGNPNKENPSGYKSFVMPLPVPIVKEHRLQDGGGGMFGGGEQADIPMGRVVFAGYRRKGKGEILTPHATPGYPGFVEGSGTLVTVPMITDAEAIEMILSSRLLTTSISTEPEFVKCSICGTNKYDMKSECDHKKGEVYESAEGKPQLCYYEMGPLHACELSYVNAPSDTTSRNIDPDIGEAGLRLLIGDKAEGRSEFHFYDLLTQEKVGMLELEGRAFVENFTLIPSIKTNPTYQINTEAIMSKNKPFVEGAEPEEEEIESTEESEDEAKLDAKSRNALPGGTFCGPNRSFPAPDKAHVIAGLRLLGRYKGPGSKASIKRCLLSKGKKYGVGSKETADGLQYGIFPIQVSTPEGVIAPWFIPCNEPEATEANQACVDFMKEFLALGDFDYRENILIQLKRLANEEGCIDFLSTEGLVEEDEVVEGEFESIKLQTSGGASDSYGWPFLTALIEHYQAQSEALKEVVAIETKNDETTSLLENFVKLAKEHNLSVSVNPEVEEVSTSPLLVEVEGLLKTLLAKEDDETSLEDLISETKEWLVKLTEDETVEESVEETVEETVEEEIDPSKIEAVDSPLVETEESNLSVSSSKIDEKKDTPFNYWNNRK